jgi:N-acetylneuraminate 9-O-acetyltransferase
VNDPRKCAALQTTGRWLEPINSWGLSNRVTTWQVPGCITHAYREQDIKQCMGCSKILFIGDSTIRKIFWATAKKLDKAQAEHQILFAPRHGDVNFTTDCSQLQFAWDPYLNGTRSRNEVETASVIESANRLRELRHPHHRFPSIALVGTGMWQVRYLGEKYLDDFSQNLNDFISPYHEGAQNLTREMSLPPSTATYGQDLLLFAPVLMPSYEKISAERAEEIRPEKIFELNNYLRDLEQSRAVNVLWAYSEMVAGHEEAFEDTGIHVNEDVAGKQADVLLNLRCNSSPQLQRYPHDKTCCGSTPSPTGSQYVLLTVVMAGTFFCPSIAVVVAAALFCYVADRSSLFQKLHKTSDPGLFAAFTAAALFVGSMTIKRPLRPWRLLGLNSQLYRPHQPYLSRAQTDEWKGWMQALILFYHYFGMSGVLPTYQLARLLVASYLFMTGFGHTVFFYTTDDFSIHRVAKVLLRLNLLTVVLTFAMGTNYGFYYFPALNSFWFLVIYLTLWFSQHSNPRSSKLLFKIVLSAIVIKTLLKTTEFDPALTRLLDRVFRMRVDLNEARFRVSLDVNIVYVGMLFALLYLHIVSCNTARQTYVVQVIKSRAAILQAIGAIVSIGLLASYCLLARRFADKVGYNRWHPIMSPLPVLAFVILRNSSQLFRDYHSHMFAWLGRYSLETFVLQYHIWLAADTKGLLSLGLLGRGSASGLGLVYDWGRWVEFIFITAFFLWTSWGVSNATDQIVEWIVGPPPMETSRWSKTPGCDRRDGSPYALSKHETTMAGGRHSDGMGVGTWSQFGGGPTSLSFRLAAFFCALWLCQWACSA